MKNYIIISLACLLIGLTIGFFAGRSYQEQQASIDFVKLPPIKIDPIILDPEIIVDENPELPVEVVKPNKEIQELLSYIDELNQDRLKNKQLIDSLKSILANTPDLVVDSLALYKDYISLRSYKNWNMFDIDTVGKFTASFDVQFNRIQRVYDGSFYPVQKTIINRQKDIWIPFVSGSYSTFGYVGVGAGLFYHDLGLEYQYQRNFNEDRTGHSFGLKYKF